MSAFERVIDFPGLCGGTTDDRPNFRTFADEADARARAAAG